MAITHDACGQFNPSQDVRDVHSALVLSKFNGLCASPRVEIQKVIRGEAMHVRIHEFDEAFQVLCFFDLHHNVEGVSLKFQIARGRVAEEVVDSVVRVDRVDLMLKESNQLGQVLQTAQRETPIAIADMDMKPCRQVHRNLEV